MTPSLALPALPALPAPLPSTASALAKGSAAPGTAETPDESGAFGRTLQGLTGAPAAGDARAAEPEGTSPELPDEDTAPDLAGWLSELLGTAPAAPANVPPAAAAAAAQALTAAAATPLAAAVSAQLLAADAAAGSPRQGSPQDTLQDTLQDRLRFDLKASAARKAAGPLTEEPATQPGFRTRPGGGDTAAPHGLTLEPATQAPGEAQNLALAASAPATAALPMPLPASLPASLPAPMPTPLAAPVEASLSPAIGSPAFAAHLGSQIAHFARDGIEHARLQLHPAEMGPISVQLALEGHQVRVDLVADMAATRQALEQSLPALAGALREAGFTLSGGGVFQQARDGGQPASTRQPPPGAEPGTEASADTAAARAARPLRTQGLVDLFA